MRSIRTTRRLGPLAAASALALLVAAPSAARNADEARMLELVNAERQARDLPVFVLNETLSRLALEHARDMKRMGKASHASSADGALFTQRLARSSLRAAAAAENVALDRNVESAHRGLMRSPGHRANLLDERLTAIGIGIVADDDGRSVYVVQDFATPIPDLSDGAALDAVRRALVSARRRAGGGGVEEDVVLSARFVRRLDDLIASDSVDIPGDLVGGPALVVAYTSKDPSELPRQVLKEIGSAASFGAAVSFRKTPSYPLGIYWVLIALVEP